MRLFEWILVAILGAVLAVSPDPTSAAVPGSLFDLAKARLPDPDRDAGFEGNLISRRSGQETGVLAPDLFMLTKGAPKEIAGRSSAESSLLPPTVSPRLVQSAPEAIEAGPVADIDHTRAIVRGQTPFVDKPPVTVLASVDAVQRVSDAKAAEGPPAPKGPVPTALTVATLEGPSLRPTPAPLEGFISWSRGPPVLQGAAEAAPETPEPQIVVLANSPVRPAPSDTVRPATFEGLHAVSLGRALTAEGPQTLFVPRSALATTLQARVPETLSVARAPGLSGAREPILVAAPRVEAERASEAEAAPLMLMSMVAPPTVAMDPGGESVLRSSGSRGSANVSAPDPLWLRKENATAKPITVATAPEKPVPSRAEAAMIDSLVSWAERQNSADTSDKNAASGGEVVVFELGSPSRRPVERPVDPIMTALPKSPRDLREQLGRQPPTGLGRVEMAAAEAKPRLPDPSLLELVSLADKAYVKAELGMAILPLAPLNTEGPDDARDTIDTITLGDLVSRANYHSEDVRADREGERSSRLAANGALSQLGPRFDARFSKGHEHSFTSVGATPIDKPGHVRADGSTVIVQPLFDAVSIAGVARDQQLARGAQSRRRATQVNVSYEAVTNYFDMLAARLALDLALKHETQMNKLLDYMAKRAQLGGASEADFERVRAVTLSAKRAVIDAKGELDAALSAMQRISGVTAVQIAVPDKLYLDLPEDADTAFTQMVRRNPELKTAFLQIKAAHEDAMAAAARAAPKINLEMGRYQSQNASGARGTTVDSRLMIVGSISLGAGTEAFQAMSQSAHVSELKHRYASALRSAKERLRTVYLSRQNISDQRAVAWQEFASNTKVADAFDEQLFSANRSLIDVLDTYQKFYQSKLNIVRISVNQMKIGYQIKQIIGDLSQDNAGDESADVASAGSR